MRERWRSVRRRIRGSVRAQLVILFFAITAAAVGFVYLYVVPQLSSSLTAERLQRLELAGNTELDPLERAATRAEDPARIARIARIAAAEADARVTLLGVRAGTPEFVVADSESDADAARFEYRAARGSAISGGVRSSVSSRDGRQVGETAIPIPAGEEPTWIAVLSTPLGEVADNVALIRRQILIAGGIALAAALLAAWYVAGVHARRLRRLEIAAEAVAGGNFRVPIPIDSSDEVGQLATTLDGMQRRLARLDSARREFIANASHELRTPVASLGGFLELLEDESPDPEAREEFLRTMREQVDRLTKLSTDLLDLSKLDADALVLSSGPVDLAAIATEAEEEFRALALRAGSALRVLPPDGRKPLARADHGRTLQIMRILIDNAIKHTPEGTTITLHTHTGPSGATVSVSDDGYGIPVANRERVFERFHSSDAAGGSGLGLAIARELARAMGGDLTLSSRPRRTTFALTLPAASVQSGVSA
jgi:two-component system, OmpR family, sensor kinase